MESTTRWGDTPNISTRFLPKVSVAEDDGGQPSVPDGCCPSNLRILICTANIGNAMPNTESLTALVPRDGSVDDVLTSPSCPLPPGVAPPTDDDMGGQFDVIVFGAQEAVFNVKSDSIPSGVSHARNSAHPPSILPSLSEDSASSSDHPPSESAGSSSTNPAKDSSNGGGGKRGRRAVDSSRAAASTAFGAVTSPIRAVGNAATDNIIKPVATGIVSAAGSTDHNAAASQNRGGLALDWVGGTKELYAMFGRIVSLEKYEVLVRFQRGEMRLAVLVRKEVMPAVSQVDVFAENTGIAGVVANKGGIVATLTLMDRVRISFLTAHLEAHEGKEHYANRCANLAEILGGARNKTSSANFDASITSHHMFVCGDLNFRVALPPPDGEEKWEGEAHRRVVREIVEKEDWETLNDADELRGAVERGDCLVGFQTLPCHFNPTFKVHREEGFNYQEKRTPSYTDRILWKSAHGLKGDVRPLVYEPVAKFATSDHKPVRGAFSVAIDKHSEVLASRTDVESRRAAFSGRGDVKGRQLHIFVSDMACTELPKMKELKQNSPYIMFVTDPKDLLRLRRSKRQIILDKMGCGGYGQKFAPKDGTSKYRDGWPRTRVHKKDGRNPDWDDSEVHLVVREPGIDGPADLAGAMLYLAVYDQQGVTANVDDVLIGTVALNLQVLAKEKEQRSPQATPAAQNQNLAASHVTGAFDMIDIDEPILKNGVERGRLTCTIISWWVSPHLAGKVWSKRKSMRKLKSKPNGCVVS